ncbi:hypothetical protein [Mesorhizobium sp. M0040]|uniref:hypothetical protein n=1 Tax=Mesorhizobium sp. M0040 TaxID=2956855 RepID=UPI00333DEDAE
MQIDGVFSIGGEHRERSPEGHADSRKPGCQGWSFGLPLANVRFGSDFACSAVGQQAAIYGAIDSLLKAPSEYRILLEAKE